MGSHFHAVVWIDHREARVFHFNAVETDEFVLEADNPTRKLHHKANGIRSRQDADNFEFLKAVIELRR